MQKLSLLFNKVTKNISSLIEKYELLKFGVAALILAIPMYPKFPFINVPGTYVSIRLEDFLVFVVSLLWFLSVLPNLKSVFKNKIGLAIIIFWVISLISLISAIFLTKTVGLSIGILHMARRIEYMIMFFIGIASVRSKADIEFYVKCIFIVIAFVFIFGVGQKYFNWPIITTQNEEYSKGIALRYMPGGHLPSTFAGHYDLAAYIIITSPVLFAFAFSDFFKDKRIKMFIFGFIAISFWLLVNTVSRISMVSYAGSVALVLFLIKKKRYIPIFLIVVAVFAAMSGDLVGRYTQVIDVYLKKIMMVNKPVYAAEDVLGESARRITSTPTPAPIPVFEDRSSSIRFNVEWPRAIRALTKNPLMGTGFSSITLATDNDYLRLLGEVGIAGFLSFMLILKRIFFVFWEKLKRLNLRDSGDLYFVAVASAIPGVLLNAVFIDVFESSKFAIMFWLMLGFAVATIKPNEKISK